MAESTSQRRTDNRSTGRKADPLLRIVVADDHALVRRFVCGVLAAEGWQICGEASNGREAVQVTLKQKPDIVVLDLCMPELNGLDATRHILKRMPGIIVFILTLEDGEHVARAVVESGAAAYVQKTDLQRLLRQLRRVRRDRAA